MQTTITVYSLDDFKSRVAALNRKAERLQCPQITYSIGEMEKDKDTATGAVWHYYPVTIDNHIIRLAGEWRLIAILELAEHLVKVVPGEACPEEMREFSDWCDHCQTPRSRNQTFVVANDAGEFKRVGRNCLADFLGISPASALGQVGLFGEIMSLGDEDFCGRGAPLGWSLPIFLGQTLAVIREFGWLSRSEAYDTYRQSTADIVIDHLAHPNTYPGPRAHVTQADEEKAAVIADWMEKLEGSNDYEYSLLQIAQNGFVTVKSAGFAASAPAAMQRKLDADLAAVGLTHVGKVGQKLAAKLTLKSTHSFNGAWGTTHLHLFVDSRGNQIVWSTSKYLEEGVYNVTATVKAHDDYKGVPRTKITHATCKAIA